tara:strand:+ start:2857 stop:3771 length:915 start_codon:yes stop_codon:yes gene_type:complete
MYELVQLNIAELAAPIDSPQLAGFVSNLDRVNLLAERSPGFRWRLQTDAGDATGITDFGPTTIVNMSSWTNILALRQFVYHSAHVEILRRKKEWFAPMDHAFQVLWWVKAGHRPSTTEAKERLITLQQEGPSAEAFTFKQPYPSPAGDTALHMICGLPGSGKTTLAKQLAATLPAHRYCPDEWISRFQNGFIEQPALRDAVEATQWQQAQLQLATNSCVILENGFWTREDRERYLNLANAGGIRVTLHFLDVPLSILKDRIAQRNENLPKSTFPVSDSALERFAGMFEAPTDEEALLFQDFCRY